MVSALEGLGVKADKNTVIWADVEDESQMALSISQLSAIVQAFKDTVLATGFSFGLYMGKYYYEKGELDTSLFDDHTWIARYYKGYDVMQFGEFPNEKYKPVAKNGMLWGWQYTSSGRVDGISGNVDLDIVYYDIKASEVAVEYYETPEFTLIDSLNKIGVDSSYENRKKIASVNGIVDYEGTAKQNMQMLSFLNEGKLIKTSGGAGQSQSASRGAPVVHPES